MVNPPLRATLYGRVSADRREGRSVDSQLELGRERAVSQGWQIVAEHRDDGISASRFAKRKQRPEWQHVMEEISAGKTDVLVVWEFSRTSRDRVISAALLAACVDAGVKLDVGGKLHDPSDPDDGFMLDLMSALSVRESSSTSKRTMRDVVARANAGKAHGSIRYGYMTVYDERNGKPLRRVLHPEHAPVVREIAERILAGESSFAVAADLNRRGILSAKGKQWRGTNLMKLVVSPTYVSRRIFNGADVGPAEWPPILTDAEHQLLVAMTTSPDRDKYRKDTRVRHLGVGIFRCGVCKTKLGIVHDRRKRPEVQTSYVCGESYCVTRQIAGVDKLIEAAITQRLAMPDIVEFLAGFGNDDDAQVAAADVIRLRNELNDLYDAVTADPPRLSQAALVRMEPRFLEQIAVAERRARPRALPRVVFDIAGPNAGLKWKALPIEQKRVVLAALLDVEILPAGRGQWRFNPDHIKATWRTAA